MHPSIYKLIISSYHPGMHLYYICMSLYKTYTPRCLTLYCTHIPKILPKLHQHTSEINKKQQKCKIIVLAFEYMLAQLSQHAL